jgi:hypothetical protein
MVRLDPLAVDAAGFHELVETLRFDFHKWDAWLSGTLRVLPEALLPSHHVLAALLRYASWLHDERRYGNTPAPVAWLCDADRLGRHPGKPGQFDNRYYLEDTLMPGPAYLRQRGITRLVHLGIENTDVRPDLADHLFQYAQKGFEVLQTSLTGGTEWAPLAPLVLDPRRFLPAGYLLAAGGGFGATVPHPSSGG